MPQPIDLLLSPRWLLPVEPAGIVLEGHSLAVNDGRIVAVLPEAEAQLRFVPRERLELPEQVLMPGLVNLHTHAAMTLMRGIADDLPLMDWLSGHIWPAEGRFAGEPFVHDGTLLACAEMLRGGVTCCNDMYFFPQAAIRAAETAGMRFVAGIATLEFPTPYAADADDYLNKGLAARDAYRDSPLVHFCLAPHAPYTVGDATFNRIATLAGQLDLPVHVHVHETAQEIADSLRQYGQRPLARLARLQLLGPATIAVHAVHLDDADLALLATHGVSVAHCPSSNLKLASGIAPITRLAAAGVNIGLGTDGAASNNRLDLFGEMRLAALLAKGVSGDARAIDAHTALAMATINGARALGLDGEIGSLLPGKAADLCAVRLANPEALPVYDVASHLVYVAGREQVSHVWVAGHARVADGLLPGLDDADLVRRALHWQGRIGRERTPPAPGPGSAAAANR
jgi:5-methylthioadenosine/S-adenosylhomocysteine deaminase